MIRYSLLLLLFLLQANLFAATAPQQWKEYTNSDGCFRISFPEEWAVSLIGDEGDDVQAVSPAEDENDRHYENVVIWAEPLYEDLNLDQYYQLSLKNLISHSRSFTLLEEGTEEVGGHTARWFHAKLQNGGVFGEVIQYQLIIDGRVYILDCTVEPGKLDVFRPIFERIVTSFRPDCS